MINIEQFTTFLIEQDISAEEGFLALAINYKQQNNQFALAFSSYYERNLKRFKYPVLIDRMTKKGYLKNLNKPNEYQLGLIQITDLFRKTLMVDIDDAYKEARQYYPKTMQLTSNGVAQTPITSFSNEADDKAVYAQYVLGGNSRPNHVRFIGIMEAVKNDPTVFPNGKAKMKWKTFCSQWDGFSDVFESKPKRTIMRM